MEKRKVIEWIEKAPGKDMQELIDAVHNRYRELHPDWEIYFFSLERCDSKTRKRKIREMLHWVEMYEKQEFENMKNI